MSDSDSDESEMEGRYDDEPFANDIGDNALMDRAQKRALNSFNANGRDLFGYGHGQSLNPREADSDLEELYELEKQEIMRRQQQNLNNTAVDDPTLTENQRRQASRTNRSFNEDGGIMETVESMRANGTLANGQSDQNAANQFNAMFSKTYQGGDGSSDRLSAIQQLIKMKHEAANLQMTCRIDNAFIDQMLLLTTIYRPQVRETLQEACLKEAMDSADSDDDSYEIDEIDAETNKLRKWIQDQKKKTAVKES